MFKKLKADMALALEILKILPEFWADYKATKVVGQQDMTDVKTAIARIEGLLGHTPAAAPHVIIVPSTGAASVSASPTAAPPPAAPTSVAGPTLQTQLVADVAKVDPLASVKLP